MILKNTKVALLFGFFSETSYPLILKNSRGIIQNAADALQKSLIEGLGVLCEDIEIFNLPYIGSYPISYKCCSSPKGEINFQIATGKVIKGNDIKFCNLIGYKRYSRYIHSKVELGKWCKKYKSDCKIIIVYALGSSFIKSCSDLKYKYHDSLKIVQIIPDLPEFMSEDKSFFKQKLKQISISFINKYLNSIDAYVLLSKYMVEYLNIQEKPWTVVEGIYTPNHIRYVEVNRKKNIKQILYTGTLAKRYGIMNLLEAFHRINDNNLELIICGAGEASTDILKLAESDKRIIYKGQMRREDVLLLQTQVDLLVNPRTPDGEYTKYSFPSKIMEYFASGTPVLIYRLPGIPDEYFNYCYVVENRGIGALEEKLKYVLSLPNSELKNQGEAAQKFILTKKNPIVQCEKIIELIEQII